MRKHYSGKILFCGVLRRYGSQNIVAITFFSFFIVGGPLAMFFNSPFKSCYQSLLTHC